MGQIDQIISSAALFKGIIPSSEFDRDPSNTRKHLFEIISGVKDGQLYIDWNYSSHKHLQSTMEHLVADLMQALRALIRQCRTVGVSGVVEANVAYMPLAREQIEQILTELEISSQDVEAIDTLSPAQQGMLYETLSASGTGIHVEQWLCTLTGVLDVEAFRRSWQWEVDRQAIFHTSFVWHSVDEPFQVALHRIAVPFAQYDLSTLFPGEQSTYLDSFAEKDRNQGFDLSQAPLMRLTLFRLSSDSYRFVLTYHHILMDLWCLHFVIKEVFACYQAYSQGQRFHLERSLPYTEYIAWLKRQKLVDAELFWRDSLNGFTRPTALGRSGEPTFLPEGPETHLSELLTLPGSLTADLQRVARQHRLTLNTLFQGPGRCS